MFHYRKCERLMLNEGQLPSFFYYQGKRSKYV
nr:MAG TPA_asm: hypothetical protein [Caudoviricetes sp.]